MKIQNLLLIAVSLFTFHFSLLTSTAQAVESTPSASIQEKLEALKQEIASKAAKLKQEVNTKLQNRAYVGTVKTRSDSSLTLAAKNGAKLVSLNQDTLYQSQVKQRTRLTAKTLQEEDYLVALGDIDNSGVLTAKKVILLSSTPKQKVFLWGQIVAVSDKLITVKTKEAKNIAVSINSNSEVKRGDEEISLSSLKINNFIIATGALNKNEIFDASFVYVIPQGGILKSKTATPNTATSSGKAKQ